MAERAEHALIGRDRALERLCYQWFGETLMPASPTHMLHWSLMPPDRCRNIARWNDRTKADRLRVIRYFFHRIDRRLYGSRHDRLPARMKFPFFVRTEARTRFGTETTAHFHGVLQLPNPTDANFQSQFPRIAQGVENFASGLGFIPDLQLVEYLHEEGRGENYAVKGLHNDADEIWTRGTISNG